ncbi:MAG TPA: alpha/beta hydrolase [Candidatus Nanoarchaeia archaeon]|nr:alpha/beta hydrolase [Candidatus Nanoarchaeia archaeon]
MTKRAFIIHGFEGNSKDCWIPWLKKSLNSSGLKTESLKMPSPNNPKLKDWIKKISESVIKPDSNTYLIGHSLGCISILRYIESLNDKDKVGGCVLVAGFIQSLNIKEIDEFTEGPLNINKINNICKDIVQINSDNDEEITLKSAKDMSKKIKSKLIVEKGKGHFDDYAKVFELPSALNEIKRMII